MICLYSHSPYSKYCSSFNINRMLKDIYPNKINNKKVKPTYYNMSYNFRYNKLTGSEWLVIYTDRPGIFIGLCGRDIDKLKEAYSKINKKCKGIKVFETRQYSVKHS